MVVGRAQRPVEADVANLVFTVVEVDGDQRAAFARCGERVNALLARLRERAGVQATVSTGHLDVDRHYSDGDGRERPDQYAVSLPVAVECSPEAAASVIAEAIIPERRRQRCNADRKPATRTLAVRVRAASTSGR